MSKMNDFLRNIYNKKLRKRLKNKDMSVISSNCCGCIMLHDLNVRFNSPFVNLWVKPKDFLKFCENMDYYLEQKLEFNDSDGKEYPVADLGDIKIYFMHFKTPEEAIEKWEIRKKRINKDNLFFIFNNRDGCTYEDLKRFDDLPFNNKIAFVQKEMPELKSAVYIPGFENDEQVGRCMSFKNKYTYKRYYDTFDYVSWFNNEKNN